MMTQNTTDLTPTPMLCTNCLRNYAHENLMECWTCFYGIDTPDDPAGNYALTIDTLAEAYHQLTACTLDDEGNALAAQIEAYVTRHSLMYA
jgi:hypothetical protein